MTLRRIGDTVATAAAKINLALRVTGRRADGYHELDSLVVFAEIGDRLEAVHATDGPRLLIDGPFAAGLSAGEDNLVLKAFRAVEAIAGPLPGLAFRLSKHLPLASGIGGGSADAAAAIRLAAEAAGVAHDDPRLPAIAAGLGADVPMCLVGTPLRARGIGERIERWEGVPPLSLLLVNPGVEVATPAVFRRLASPEGTSIPPPPRTPSPAELAAWLEAATRNDLQAAAIAIAPAIAEALAEVARQRGCRLARMSGSGATVFGLFDDDAAAVEAAGLLERMHPGWWVAATTTGASPASD